MTHEIIILTDRRPDTFDALAAPLVRSPRDYIANAETYPGKAIRVINLVPDCSYLGLGYYASLLAEARGHTVIPSVETVVSLERKSLWQLAVEEFDAALNRRMKSLGAAAPSGPFELFVAFGQAEDERFEAWGRMIYDRFRFPLLLVDVDRRKDGAWHVVDLETIGAKDLSLSRETVFQDQLRRMLTTEWRPPKARTTPRYTMAMLHNPADALPPSDPVALKRFVKAGRELGIAVELVTKADLPRLAEYDALFIRETTNVNHHTFRFARKAEEEGMPVIDDSLSILRCTNKVYLAELLEARNISRPYTRVLDRKRLKTIDAELEYPMVLKVPDGSFSRGVVKVSDRKELLEVGGKLLEKSDLILAQAFMPTEYDWRVGVLNGQPLYVCQYLMSTSHWQIVNHKEGGGFEQGGYRTIPVDEAPPEVVALGLRAAGLMGNGLYGVDIKQTTDYGCVVIEVNDNPSIESDVEDQVLGMDLYRAVMREFLRRLEAARA